MTDWEMGLAYIAYFVLATLFYLVMSLIRPLPPFRSRLKVLFVGFPSAMIIFMIMIIVAVEFGYHPDNPENAGATSKAKEETIAPAVAETPPGEGDKGDGAFAVAGATQHNESVSKRVTYRDLRTTRLDRSKFSANSWTIKADHADVFCFADGNNAIFLIMDRTIMAANGKARQFVNYKDGDGILLEDGTIQKVLEPDPEKHGKLLAEAIDIGVKLCGQKNLKEISEAVGKATGQAEVATQGAESVYHDAALAMVGAKICDYQLDAVALVDYLQAKGIDQATFEANSPPYITLAEGILKAGDKSLCQELLLPKFGKNGFGFISD